MTGRRPDAVARWGAPDVHARVLVHRPARPDAGGGVGVRRLRGVPAVQAV